ncbi:MAG: aspartate 1-decarboxylase [Deltaproteobacteria bacterium]|nr:aspartate 1-decarboxylase [Deltaproteobacteria bacterium]MBW1952496.1 aspartate 1-decarboxylase [Deltaproteobacteria bacterium]MBW1987547.1 aspartate 1-decarboxylase [Deltaproteobacteria bacterium]MBW2135309.1 aspartate 1-decarboxylase [Deltaproteobacteria bacterium]
MMRTMLKSKIHRATVTMSDLHYEGSLTIDCRLMQLANILPYEMVHVYNISNGERFQTYALEGEAGSGVICLNGAAARKGAPGDLIIITTYATYSEAELQQYQPLIILVDAQNQARMPFPKKSLSF